MNIHEVVKVGSSDWFSGSILRPVRRHRYANSHSMFDYIFRLASFIWPHFTTLKVTDVKHRVQRGSIRVQFDRRSTARVYIALRLRYTKYLPPAKLLWARKFARVYNYYGKFPFFFRGTSCLIRKARSMIAVYEVKKKTWRIIEQ